MASGADYVDAATAAVGAGAIGEALKRRSLSGAKWAAKTTAKKIALQGPTAIVADLVLPEEAGAGADNIEAGRSPAFQAEIDRQQRLRGAVGAKMEKNKPGKVLP